LADSPGRTARTGSVVRPRLAGGAADGVAHAGERRVGIGAQGRDGGDAHHDDQCEHDRVFNGRRAVFTLQEIHESLSERTHNSVPFEIPGEESSTHPGAGCSQTDRRAYEATAVFRATLLKTLLALVPSAVMAVMHT